MVLTTPHLDVYYASTCAPCRVELPVLVQALENGTIVRVRIVDGMAQAIVDLSAVSQRLAQDSGAALGTSPNDRLRRAGDADGILPYSQSVDARGHVCASWRGMLTLSRIRTLLSKCP